MPEPKPEPERTEREVHVHEDQEVHVHSDQEVDEASEESFPASDPPGWTPTTLGTDVPSGEPQSPPPGR